jgi:hypothetical protein
MATPNSYFYAYTTPVQQQVIYNPLLPQGPKLTYTLNATGTGVNNNIPSLQSTVNGVLLFASGPGFGQTQTVVLPSSSEMCTELNLTGYSADVVYSFDFSNANSTSAYITITGTQGITGIVPGFTLAKIGIALNPNGGSTNIPSGALIVAS